MLRNVSSFCLKLPLTNIPISNPQNTSHLFERSEKKEEAILRLFSVETVENAGMHYHALPCLGVSVMYGCLLFT